MSENGARDPELSAKIRAGKIAFLRKEAAAVGVQLARWVDHSDELGVPIARRDFETLQRAYQILESYGKGAL